MPFRRIAFQRCGLPNAVMARPRAQSSPSGV
jgi:hypothetical protein